MKLTPYQNRYLLLINKDISEESYLLWEQLLEKIDKAIMRNNYNKI